MNKVEFDKHLLSKCREFKYDPVGWVKYFFPWKQKGTDLEDEEGLDVWQEDFLNDLAEAMEGDPAALQRFAVASTHGSGKSALVAIFILFYMSTRPQANIVVTANTDSQLKTKTFREVAVWHDRVLNKHWFSRTATKIEHVSDPTWICNAIPNNPEKPEAIAGSHAKNMCVIIDEASAIDPMIYESLYGAMSTPGAIWLTFGNGTRNHGPFFDSFHSMKHRWNTRHIDGRDCKMTNKKLIQEMIDDYGIGHDIVKVRWLGLFPAAADDVLISPEVVDAAGLRQLGPEHFHNYPVVFGLDVGRGLDESILVRRQGPKALIIGNWRERDLMKLVNKVYTLFVQQRPDTVYIDETGLGAGVHDRLKELLVPVVGVNFATSAVDERSYAQTRSEIWGNMGEWLKGEVDIQNDKALTDQLKSQPYGYNEKMQIQLMSKKHMKELGYGSPDRADALATTFYSEVLKRMKPRSSARRVLPSNSRGWT